MLPEFLIQMLENQYGSEIAEKIKAGFLQKRVVSFRVNTIKSNVDEIIDELDKNKIKYEQVKWSKEAFIFENTEEEVIRALDIYKSGKIYLQSLSSMLPPIVLEPKEGEDILDMTAAPGGKTTEIAALSNNRSHITACEMNNIRIEKLKYNVEMQGASSVYIMQKDSRKIDDFFSFDKILLDAPCSGSGTININDKGIEKYFTTKLIEKSVLSQTQLLRKALKILKKGHTMVYSTCSILDKENEEVVNKIIREENAEIVPICFEGMDSIPILPSKIEGTICIMPSKYYEGFFMAKIKKK